MSATLLGGFPALRRGASSEVSSPKVSQFLQQIPWHHDTNPPNVGFSVHSWFAHATPMLSAFPALATTRTTRKKRRTGLLSPRRTSSNTQLNSSLDTGTDTGHLRTSSFLSDLKVLVE